MCFVRELQEILRPML